MASKNLVIIMGNLGRDPEVKTTPSGAKVANFSIATTDKGYTKKDGTQVEEKTEWHNLVAWNRQAEVIEQYVKKGSSLYVEGKLTTRSWDDTTSGQKRYRTEILVESFQFLGGGQQQSNQGGQQAPQTSNGFGSGGGGVQNDDDLPF